MVLHQLRATEYLADITGMLAEMAKQHRLFKLWYILEMARAQAADDISQQMFEPDLWVRIDTSAAASVPAVLGPRGRRLPTQRGEQPNDRGRRSQAKR
jgi:hypothetical protein